MIDPATIAILQKQLRRTGRSFLSYVQDSFPWTRGRDGEVMRALQKLVQKEQEAAAALARFLSRHHAALPHLGPYPMHFTSYNFLGLDGLLPLLVAHQKEDVEDLENDLAAVTNEDCRAMLRDLLKVKQESLRGLTELHGRHAAKTVVAPADRTEAASA